MQVILPVTFRASLLALLLAFWGGCTSVVAQESAVAQENSSPLRDINGDSAVNIATFGDSLTFGIGEGIPEGVFLESLPEGTGPGGYPKRLATLLGVTVGNGGLPGEEFIASGVERFATSVLSRTSDFVIFLEGSNDAVKRADRGVYARGLQKVINVARADGREMVLVTIPPPVGVHAALAPFTSAFSTAVRELAATNDLLLADAERAWISSCPDLENCRFYSIPEGLHPNNVGYTALAQLLAATFLGIDIFSPAGASELEAATGLAPGSVVIRPDVSVQGVS